MVIAHARIMAAPPHSANDDWAIDVCATAMRGPYGKLPRRIVHDRLGMQNFNEMTLYGHMPSFIVRSAAHAITPLMLWAPGSQLYLGN